MVFGLSWASDAALRDARSHLNQGDYDQAITLGTEMETAEGLILAAESLSAKVMLGYVDSPKNGAKKARKWAQAAIEQDPQSQEARVQYALAYGFETRASSPFRAWRKNLPEKTLSAIEYVRTIYPDDPRGDALLGAWHLGIVRKAGDKNAQKWFDASEAAGMAHYDLALKAAPDDIVIAANYALVLLSIDQDRHMERAADMIRHIKLQTPKNAMETEVQTRMNTLLDYEDPADLTLRVEKLLDG